MISSQALYAADFIFLLSYRPCGTVDESKSYFIGKYQLNNYETEFSVFLIGLGIVRGGYILMPKKIFKVFDSTRIGTMSN